MNKTESFLDFKSFWEIAGEKRSKSKALIDINMFKFKEIQYNKDTDEYIADIEMKQEYHDGYMVNPYLVENNLIFLDTIHLVHWANWLNISIISKLYPELERYFFMSTRMEMVLDEPTFINQPIIYKMKILTDEHEEKKHKFTFMNRIGKWGYIIDDYMIVEEQFAIMKHYHRKHEKGDDTIDFKKER